MPLMNRTVRVDNGAWLLLKKPAVRARATATSFESACVPKFAAAVTGAPGLRNTARTFPCRSVTAMTIGAFTEAAAFCTTNCTSAAVKTAGGSSWAVALSAASRRNPNLMAATNSDSSSHART